MIHTYLRHSLLHKLNKLLHYESLSLGHVLLCVADCCIISSNCPRHGPPTTLPHPISNMLVWHLHMYFKTVPCTCTSDHQTPGRSSTGAHQNTGCQQSRVSGVYKRKSWPGAETAYTSTGRRHKIQLRTCNWKDIKFWNQETICHLCVKRPPLRFHRILKCSPQSKSHYS